MQVPPRLDFLWQVPPLSYSSCAQPSWQVVPLAHRIPHCRPGTSAQAPALHWRLNSWLLRQAVPEQLCVDFTQRPPVQV